jgi:hypothetical protein
MGYEICIITFVISRSVREQGLELCYLMPFLTLFQFYGGNHNMQLFTTTCAISAYDHLLKL